MQDNYRVLNLNEDKNRSAFVRIYDLLYKRKPNRIKTSKYTLLNFVFKCGFEQFYSLSNVYFLAVVVLAYIGEYTDLYETPFSGAGTLIALSVVIIFTMTFEALYDIRRHLEDKKLNSRNCFKLNRKTGCLEVIKWDAISPGDIIKVSNKEEVPADLILLTSTSSDSKCYVETANIDGETNLKVKQVPPAIANEKGVSILNLSSKVELQFEEPSSQLSFNGSLCLSNGESKEIISLHFKNMLLRGYVLRNTRSILGLVVYTGRDTKVSKSCNRNVPKKISKIQRIINNIVLSVFGLTVLLCVISTTFKYKLFQSDSELWYLGYFQNDYTVSASVLGSFVSFLILYSGLIPISLLVILAFANYVQAQFIYWDDDMCDMETGTRSKCNTMELVQEIGQIDYVLSDKTGTLTQNDMALVGIGVKNLTLGCQDVSETSKENTVSLFSVEALKNQFDNLFQHSNAEHLCSLREFMEAMAICHTVLIDSDEKELTYNAEGPDEEALVLGASRLGYALKSTNNGHYIIETFGKETIKAKVLAVNEFTSDRKCMSILVKRKVDGIFKYVLYVKGADNIIIDKLITPKESKAQQNFYLNHQLSLFSQQGLRTLVFAYKIIEDADAQLWLNSYQAARKTLGRDKDNALSKSAALIERDLTYLGVSAIEDKLQPNVAETVRSIVSAGIKFWVLTGDKVETALNIGFSAGIIEPEFEVVKLVSKERELNIKTLVELEETLIPQNFVKTSKIREQGKRLLNKLSKLNRITLESIYDTGRSIISRTTSLSKPRRSVSKESIQTVAESVPDNLQQEQNKKPQEYQAQNLALVLNGDSLSGILSDQNGTDISELLLFKIACMCSVVIACRVSPYQKALLVKLIHRGHARKSFKPRLVSFLFNAILKGLNLKPLREVGERPITLAIGDGANDVAMIQEAKVGVGIIGKEGSQASNSADFKIKKFCFLKPLLLKHGRYNYLRASTLTLFVFYSQILFAITFFVYGFENKFSGGTVFYVYLLTFYTYPTNVGIALVSITNIDISPETVLAYPALYAAGRLNTHLSTKKIYLNLLLSVVHALFICLCQLYLFPPKDLTRDILSSSVFLNCVLLSSVLCMLETSNWTFLNFAAILFCIGSFLIVEPLYYNLDPRISTTYSGSALWSTTQGPALYIWSVNAFVVMTCLLFEVIRRYIKREYFPSIEDIVLEIDRGYSEEADKSRFLKNLEKTAKAVTQPFKIPRQAIVELMTALQNVNIRPARYSRNFAFDSPQM